MAAITYYSTNIKQNIIGDNPNVTSSQPVPLNTLVKSLGTEKLVLNSFNLWSDNRLQLIQPVSVVKTKADGSQDKYTVFPQLDSFQVQNVLNNYSLNDLEFDQDSKFEYRILPNSKLQLTLNIDDSVRKYLSATEQLKQAENEAQTPQAEEKPLETISAPQGEEKQPETDYKAVWVLALVAVSAIVLLSLISD